MSSSRTTWRGRGRSGSYRELPDGWIVRKGLQAGDRIVVDGVIRVRPGNVVKPVPSRHRRGGRPAGGRQAVISKFFIDRPVFASVLSIVIVLAGLVAMRVLPISQYPQIVPPEVVVSATYPGATAETIAATVAAPLEQQINGVERMIYMQSTSTGSGTMNLTVTFEIGTNPDQNAINVNNRVQRALPLLPAEVSRQGLVVQKRSTSILQVLTMSSPDGPLRHDLHQQLRAGERARRDRAACRASATPRCSAPRTIRCASGSGPTSSRSTISRRPTSPPWCASRTSSSPPAASARSR